MQNSLPAHPPVITNSNTSPSTLSENYTAIFGTVIHLPNSVYSPLFTVKSDMLPFNPSNYLDITGALKTC